MKKYKENFQFRFEFVEIEKKTLSDFKMNSIDFPLKYIKLKFKKFLLIEY